MPQLQCVHTSCKRFIHSALDGIRDFCGALTGWNSLLGRIVSCTFPNINCTILPTIPANVSKPRS